MKSFIKSGLRRLARAEKTRPTGPRNATIIAVAAQKGGVGKTTTSVNLAAGLARFHGKRVLLIDLDPQGHVNTALKNQVYGGGASLARVLTEEHGDLEVMDIVTRTDLSDLDVTPFDPALAGAEDLIGIRMGKEFLLRDALAVTRSWYDVIVIDCPPNLGNLTINGLVAADCVLIPCDPSPLALNGVETLVQTITTIATRLNPEIDVLGVLMTRVDGRNTTLNADIMGRIEQRYGEALLPVTIGINSSLAKAQAAGHDIFAYDEKSRGAAQYRELTDAVATHL